MNREEEMISIAVVNKLPVMFTLLDIETIKDMEGNSREALKITWPERGQHIRTGHFCRLTGEYLGDTA